MIFDIKQCHFFTCILSRERIQNLHLFINVKILSKKMFKEKKYFLIKNCKGKFQHLDEKKYSFLYIKRSILNILIV